MSRRLLQILALIVVCWGCGDRVDDKADGGTTDSDGGTQTDMAATPEAHFAVLRDSEYLPLAQEGELEIISGFQGGWHLEPHLRFTGIDSEELVGRLTVRAIRNSTMVAETGQQLMEPIFFDQNGDSYYFFSQPVIFLGNDIPAEFTGSTVTLVADIELEDGRAFDVTAEVGLTNEVEEFEF